MKLFSNFYCKYCNKETIYILLVASLIVFQMWHYYEFKTQIQSFMNVGSRFTASHGQDLCVRVQNLEGKVIGESLPCTFIPPPVKAND